MDSTMNLIIAFASLISVGAAIHNANQPLFLTPYLEYGLIEEARRLSSNEPLLDSVRSHSGFLTINETTGNNLFFWYFPAEFDNGNAPFAIWLNGGPGCSSMYGALFEIGPYEMKGDWVVKRDYSWNKHMNILFIDNPAGTGFSFSQGLDYPTNEDEVGRGLLNALIQFFELFPELTKRNFYIMGESYGGKYVPALAHYVHNYNRFADERINLRGISIGNGIIDPINQMIHGQHQYQLGLIDEKQLNQMNNLESEIVEDIKAKRWRKAAAGFKSMFWNYKGEPDNLLLNNTGFTAHYNILDSSDDATQKLTKFLTRPIMKEILHVGNLPFNNGRTSENYLFEDMTKSVLPWFIEIASNYDVLLYSGQLDIILPYPTQENFLKKMRWSGAAGYRMAPREIWRVGKDIAGYVKTLYHKSEMKNLHFSHVMVRSAGHIVPRDQPRVAYNMIKSFILGKKPF